MKGSIGKISQFMKTPVGIIVLFVLIFYVMTFSVYWFYSPGPEERRQAEAAQSLNPAGAEVPAFNN